MEQNLEMTVQVVLLQIVTICRDSPSVHSTGLRDHNPGADSALSQRAVRSGQEQLIRCEFSVRQTGFTAHNEVHWKRTGSLSVTGAHSFI